MRAALQTVSSQIELSQKREGANDTTLCKHQGFFVNTLFKISLGETMQDTMNVK